MTILDHSNKQLKLVVATPVLLATFWLGLQQNEKHRLETINAQAPVKTHTTPFEQLRTKVSQETSAISTVKAVDPEINTLDSRQQDSRWQDSQHSDELLTSTQPLVKVRRGPVLKSSTANQPTTGTYNNSSFVPSPRDVTSGLVATIDQTTGQIRYGHHPRSYIGSPAE